MRDFSRNIIHQISRTYRFNPSNPRDFNRKNTNRPPPAQDLLAIFQSYFTEGRSLLSYFERFGAGLT